MTTGAYLLYFSGLYPWWQYVTLDFDASPGPVHELLFSWSAPLMDVAFSCGAVHWALCIYEDTVGWRYLAQAVDDDSSVEFVVNPNQAMWHVYTLHHIFTMGAYVYALTYHELSSL